MASLDSFKCTKNLNVGAKTYEYFSLKAAEKHGLAGISRLPFCMKVVLENLLRNEDGRTVKKEDIEAVAAWLQNRGKTEHEIAFRPARVLMQDFTGVPAVVDLAAMRDAMVALGGDPHKINPLVPVDLVIDHSVVVDYFGTSKSLGQNVKREYEQNQERYRFLKWGQQGFSNFSVVPPGTGICHQVNLEYLAQTVWTAKEKRGGKSVETAYPDTLVGTDSHTTMVNGLAVLGWGVGGIEAEAAMLGQPLSMLLPEVVGFKLTGELREGVTATDLVLTVTQMLRKKGVVGKFVEFFGPGLNAMSVADRATIANMAPEYGATCGLFPIDGQALGYLNTTSRKTARIALVKSYAKAQGIYRTRLAPDPVFTDTLELELGEVAASLAGPKRPQDRVPLADAKAGFIGAMTSEFKQGEAIAQRYKVEESNFDLGHGHVVIAAITSCTNTSNPSVMMAAGLLARNAVAKGLAVKPWVKTSLAPGSQVVEEYLEAAELQKPLDKLGFNIVGYGCTTCIGNSGPLAPPISATIAKHNLVAAAVLSGNRNFEGRVNPDVRANYLASPPLVVAYALAGSMQVDLIKEPIGHDKRAQPVYLADIWPTSGEVQDLIDNTITAKMFKTKYSSVFDGDANWKKVRAPTGPAYAWDMGSTYVQHPPYFEGMTMTPEPIEDVVDAQILGLFLDSITTDHISPAGSIRQNSPAGEYLLEHQVRPADFNQYGTRRGNHEVMMRGTFANIRIKNQMVKDEHGAVVEGGYTLHYPSGERMWIYDAAMRYQSEKVPLIVFAGREYGTGSSRDWAAKGTKLLGVRAVVAQSFERIHRSNLVGMGVLPCVFEEGTSWITLGLKGDETVSIHGLGPDLKPRQRLEAEIKSADGQTMRVPLICRIDTLDELEYFRNGGILAYVLRQLASVNLAARENLSRQAEWCARLGSPFTALVCKVLHERLTEGSAFAARLLNWPGEPEADAIALRACGALNFFARAGHPALAPLYPPHPLPSEEEYWDGAEAAIRNLDERLTRFLDSAPQTNEVARSAALLPGYLGIASRAGLPLSICEIGASAGLNLGFHRYGYDYGAFTWGPPDAAVKISCEWRGKVEPWSGAIEVADRRGCDIHPIDPGDPVARARMLAYIWPDQVDRLARAEAALDLAAQLGPRVEAIDAARFAERELRAGASGTALVLAHTIFWQYLPGQTKAAIRAAIAEAAGRATKASPFAWLRLEAEAEERRGGVLRLSLWPDGPVDEVLAVASFHGQWIEWQATV